MSAHNHAVDLLNWLQSLCPEKPGTVPRFIDVKVEGEWYFNVDLEMMEHILGKVNIIDIINVSDDKSTYVCDEYTREGSKVVSHAK